MLNLLRVSCIAAVLLLRLADSSAQQVDSDLEQYLGQSDFRYVKPLSSKLTSAPRCGGDAWEAGNFWVPNASDTSRLLRPNVDSLSIRLKAASFAYFPERKWWKQSEEAFGQIGIFVDVNMTSGAAVTPGINQVPGRLIYYDSNYEKSQLRITATNVHVLGPVVYPGGGLALAMTLLEFDRDVDDVFSTQVLEGLTKLGTEASRGVPAYLVGPLAALSEAVRNSAKAKDDVFGRVYLGLNGTHAAENPPMPVLVTGDLVFIRKRVRTTPVDWENLCYQDSTGAVSPRKDKTVEPFGYVTLSVLKNADNDASSVRDGPSYEAFVRELEKRPPNVSTSAGAEAALNGLRQRLIDDAVRTSLNDLGAVSISNDDRIRAAYVVAHAVHASLVAPLPDPFKGADLVPDPRCAYLKLERRGGADRAILLQRLQDINADWSRERLANDGRVSAPPKSCQDALDAVDALAKTLASMPNQAK